MWPDPRKKAAKRKEEPAKRTRNTAKRKEKAAKRLRGRPGNKSSPRLSRGRNRLFPLNEIKRTKSRFITTRGMRRTTNQFRMTCTSVTRPLHIRSRQQALGRDRLAKAKSKSISSSPSRRTFRLKNRRSGSRKSAIRITNGNLKT